MRKEQDALLSCGLYNHMHSMLISEGSIQRFGLEYLQGLVHTFPVALLIWEKSKLFLGWYKLYPENVICNSHRFLAVEQSRTILLILSVFCIFSSSTFLESHDMFHFGCLGMTFSSYRNPLTVNLSLAWYGFSDDKKGDRNIATISQKMS